MTHASKDEPSVLITDDIAQNRVYIGDILREIIPDLTIYEAENGQEAASQVEDFILQHGRSPDLIIMDYRMPVLNGADATTAIRQIEAKLTPSKQSIIITWSTSLQSPYPQADDWLPKMTNVNEVKRMLIQFELLQGS